MNDIEQILITQAGEWGPKAGLALLIALVFWFVSVLLRKIIHKIGERFDLDVNVVMLFARTMRLTVMVFGVITVLGTLGINIQALVAGLGLTGFALGFALKDMISNLLSGVLLLVYRPFGVGDNIRIAGFSGVVTSIDLRYTILQEDNKKLLIPNAKLFTDPVTVVSSAA